MDRSTPASAFERVGRTVAYGLLGVVGTGAVALASLHLTQPVQGVIYGALYLQIGPSEATETAILAHFLAAAIAGIGVPTLIGDYLSDRLANGRTLGAGIAAMAGLLGVFLVAALAGLAAFLTALAVLVVGVVAVPVALRYRFGVRSGGLSAFAGGVPVVVLLLLLAGFGLGWGWGYVVTAREVPAGAVNETPVDFEGAPAVERALFDAENCETDAEDRQVCHFLLRGHERERAAVRFLARHGVRCPYQNARSPARSGALVAEHDGSHFRVTCSPHGD